jgi:hypothetical protein
MQVERPLRLDHTALQITENTVLDTWTAKLQELPGLDCQVGKVIRTFITDWQIEGFGAALFAVGERAPVLDGFDVAHRLAECAVAFVVRVVVWVAHGGD